MEGRVDMLKAIFGSSDDGKQKPNPATFHARLDRMMDAHDAVAEKRDLATVRAAASRRAAARATKGH